MRLDTANEQEKQSAAGLLTGQQQIMNPATYYSLASSSNQSIMQAPLQSPGLGGLLGGIAGGVIWCSPARNAAALKFLFSRIEAGIIPIGLWLTHMLVSARPLLVFSRDPESEESCQVCGDGLSGAGTQDCGSDANNGVLR
jgi:hypothetical protein